MKKKLLITFIILLLIALIAVGVCYLVKDKKEKEDTKQNLLTMKIPTTEEGATKYIEKKFEGDKIPKDILDLFESLKLADEEVPDGLGFESAYFIDYVKDDKKVSYVLIGHPYLCDLDTKKCYASDKDFNSVIFDYNPQLKINKVKLSIATNSGIYIEKEYTEDNIPEHIKRIMYSLEIDSERIPENVGFQGMNSIDVTMGEVESRYVLTGHKKLCELSSKECFVTTENLDELFTSK